MYIDKYTYDRITAERIKNEKDAKIKHPYFFSHINSFVVDLENTYIWPVFRHKRVRRGKNIYDEVHFYDFSFELDNKVIFEEDISKLEVFFPCHMLPEENQEFKAVFYQQQYKWTSPNTILEKNDLQDIYLIFYKDTTPSKMANTKEYSVEIYHSFTKIAHLEHVVELPRYKMSFDCFRFKQFDSVICTSIYTNGTIVKENELDMSLGEWNKYLPFVHESCDLETIYSSRNKVPFDAPGLKWNSPNEALWECDLGHIWTAPINEYTTRRDYYLNRCLCPTCLSVFPNLHAALFHEQRRLLAYIKDNVESFEEEDLEHVKEQITIEFKRYSDLVEKDVWIDNPKDEEQLSYFFVFPNGKQGDIDKYVAEKYGSVEKVSAILYKGTLPKEHFEKLAYVSYGIPEQLLIDSHVLDPGGYRKDAFGNYIFTYYLPQKWYYYRDLYNIAYGERERFKEIEEILLRYYNIEQKKKDDLYNQIVAEGKTSRKWINEQQLYALVKDFFEDAVFQFRTKWLGAQSLDIYIPSVRVGIEYQGAQHYMPIDFFGGEESLRNQQEKDERKRQLCKKNQVELLEWNYSVPVTKIGVKELLSRWLL